MLLAAALVSGLLLACGDEEDVELRWTTDLASQAQNLHEVGAANESVYGWNRLTGKSQIDGKDVDIEMLGNVAYERGNGLFWGFVTATFADGSRSACGWMETRWRTPTRRVPNSTARCESSAARASTPKQEAPGGSMGAATRAWAASCGWTSSCG